MEGGSNLSIGYGGLEFPYPSSDQIVPGSPMCSLLRGNGTLIYTSISIAGTGAQVLTNCFTFDGPIQLIELWAVFTDVTDVTQIDDIYFDVYDGTNVVQLTTGNPGGAVASGATIMSSLVKDDDDNQAIAFLDADQIRYEEPASQNQLFYGGYISPKNGVTNYVRFCCDTDANTDATLTVFLSYACRFPGTVVAEA